MNMRKGRIKKFFIDNSKKIKIWLAVFAAFSVLLASVLTSVHFGTLRNPLDYISLPIYDLPDSARATVDKTGAYLGHPDLVETDDGKLIVMYPLGHGRGQIAEKISMDFGKSWSDRVPQLPASFAGSQETPTLYNLKFTNGNTKLVLISGCPRWPGTRIKADGFNFSFSDDDGVTWSEFQKFHSPADAIVAMSSLTQLKENGAFVDKWMGTFHDHNFVVYKTILTFDEKGEADWSRPEPLMPENRSREKEVGLCEVEIIRTPAPSDDTLIMIGRGNSRVSRSLIAFSYDEGKSWSGLKELPYDLTGDRHKAEYDAESGKLLISFRQLIPVGRSAISLKKDLSDGWYGWVGTFEDLLTYADDDSSNDASGEALIRLGKTYRNFADCGYSGTVCREGVFTAVSYGCFDKDAKNPYIMSVTFKLSDIIK